MGFQSARSVPADAAGNVPTSWQDQHTEHAIAPLHFELNTGSLLSAPTVLDDNDLTLDPGHGANAGEIICIKEATHFYWGTILDFDGGVNVPTMDTPLDHAYTTAAEVCVGEANLTKGGAATLAAPVVATLGPNPGNMWDITRIHVNVYDDGAMDSSMFGTEAALTNGIVLRQVNGTSKNIGNVKSNGDLSFLASEHEYDPKAKSGFDSLNAHFVFGGPSHVGSVIRLDGATDEVLQVIIQDTLTAVLALRVMAIGHVVTD